MKRLSVKIAPVSTNNDIQRVADLAKEIWTQHFTAIIGASQVNYMLTNFQSPTAIKSQINDGAEYYLTQVENEWVGYIGLIPDFEQNKMMLSKFYVKNTSQGKGVGHSMLAFIEKKCSLEKFSSIWLTVNKFNVDTITWYKHHGFSIIEKIKKDIGAGFFMDDYLMEKVI